MYKGTLNVFVKVIDTVIDYTNCYTLSSDSFFPHWRNIHIISRNLSVELQALI